MNYLDLFSGIGGFALGAYWAGMKFDNHFCSDIEPYAEELYKLRFPDSIQLGDIYKIDTQELIDEYGKEWVITGGFPCQPYSISGNKRGSGDDRYVWPEMFRIISMLKPSWIIIENVPGIINMDLNQVLIDLESKGYTNRERETKIDPLVIPACSVGHYHRRDRLWILAYSNAERWEGLLCDNKESKFKKIKKTNTLDSLCSPFLRFEQRVGKPAVFGMDDGVPNRMDRLGVSGNSIVPQIAEILFRQIKPYMDMV